MFMEYLFSRRSSAGEQCQIEVQDVDLRQSENDVRTKRRKLAHGRRRRHRGGRQLSMMMSYENSDLNGGEPLKYAFSARSEKKHPRTIAKAYSLVTDPIYSQVDKIRNQLNSPKSTGLESLLNSKSKLDQMREQFDENEEDVYYYYYYEDDFLKNEINNEEPEAVTDNFAVEHAQREFVVLPDGSPVPSSFFTHRPSSVRDTTPNPKLTSRNQYTTQSGDRYFHTGMLKDITENEMETQYPTPAYFQRSTSSSINRNKSPGASISIFDPMTYLNQDQGEQASTKSTTPGISLNDLTTTLASVNPDDEFILKHDGVQWLFLRREDQSTTNRPPVVTSGAALPHQIKIKPTEESELYQPHIVFKHPSGKVTEMHIEESDEDRGKIVTVIQTDQVTQNITKFKIDEISELDRVIETVFDVPGIEVTTFPQSLPEKVTRPYVFETTYSKTPESTIVNVPSNLKQGSGDKIFLFTSSPNEAGNLENIKTFVSNNVVDDEPTTVYNTPSSAHKNQQYETTSTMPTRIFQRITGVPSRTTRFTKKPATSTVRFTEMNKRVPDPVVITTKPKPTVATTFYRNSDRPQSTVAQKTPQYITSSNWDSSTPSISNLFETSDIPTRYITTLDSVDEEREQGFTTLRQFLSQQRGTDTTNLADEQEITEPTRVTFSPPDTTTVTHSPIFVMEATQNPVEAFSTMLTRIGAEPPRTTQKPLFKISTTTNGKVSTKSYSTIADALEDLKTMTRTTLTADTEVTAPYDSRQTTTPFFVQHSTIQPETDTPTRISLQNLITDPAVTDVTIINEDVCGDSYIGVDDLKVCSSLLRTASIRNEVKGK